MARGTKTVGTRPVAIDLFCGAGGMSLGFEQAGFDVILAIDVDGHHAAAHARNFPRSVTMCKSIVALSAGDLYAALGGKVEVDLVFGGPPCQGFSSMGLRDAQDPRNTLVDQFARLVAELQPKAFVMENVPGILAGASRDVLRRTFAFLTGAGYCITEPVRVLDASDFGVPQKRKRLFLLGIREDVAQALAYPEGPCPGQPLRPTVWEAIADLPRIEDRDELLARDWIRYDRPPESEYAKVARGVANDPSDYSYRREWQSDRCTGCLRIRHTPKAVEVYAATSPGHTVPGHKLPRLDPNGICPTLRAGSDSTHGSYTAPRPIHPHQPRCITAREAARLHGFPDWFACYPLKWHAYRQIGNAVCPPVARAIGRQVMEALGYAPRKSIESLRLTDEFVLPADRPRARKRIPHVENYPPVVEYLFERAYDEKAGQLRRPRFTYGDVQKAIVATGVNLSWTRADTFVQEIARSRNVLQILEACFARGYSIRALNYREFIGEFVPAGEPGTVDDKDIVHVRSRDVADALPIVPASSVSLRALHTLPDLLLEDGVVASLWQKRTIRVELEAAGDASAGGIAATYRLRNGKGIIGRGCLVVSPPGNLPTRARIARLAKGAGTEEVLVIVPITAKHVLATRFEGCLESPREACRKVYEVVAPEPSIVEGAKT